MKAPYLGCLLFDGYTFCKHVTQLLQSCCKSFNCGDWQHRTFQRFIKSCPFSIFMRGLSIRSAMSTTMAIKLTERNTRVYFKIATRTTTHWWKACSKSNKQYGN